MSIITGILANYKAIGTAVLLIVIAVAGFWLKGRIDRAAEADGLAYENAAVLKQIDAERAARRKINDENILLSAQIKEFETKTAVDVQTVIKKVRILVHDDRQCDIPVEVLKGLNQARGYQ